MVWNDRADADDICHCPCGPKFAKFRYMYDVDSNFSFDCTSTSKFTPRGLYNHLQSKSKDRTNLELQTLHILALTFIQTKYKEYVYDSKSKVWYKHKALYGLNDNNYRLADAADNAHIQFYLENLLNNLSFEKKLNEDREKEIEELRKVS
jgi:hypothetical protein